MEKIPKSTTLIYIKKQYRKPCIHFQKKAFFSITITAICFNMESLIHMIVRSNV